MHRTQLVTCNSYQNNGLCLNVDNEPRSPIRANSFSTPSMPATMMRSYAPIADTKRIDLFIGFETERRTIRMRDTAEYKLHTCVVRRR